LDYAFSHASTAYPAGDQVHIYFPEKAHNSSGVVRTIVLDSTDPPETGDPTFLDSDGCVTDPGCRGPQPPLNDGNWHFITLSTHPQGGKGVDFYLDGALVGTMQQGVQYGSPGDAHIATGGGPLNLNGTLHVCSRVDEDPERFFSGSIAHLRLYNSALSAAQVKALYDADSAVQGVAAAPQSEAVPAATAPLAGPQQMAPPAAPSTGSAALIGGLPACSPQPIAGIATLATCGEGYACAPLSQQQLVGALGSTVVAAVVNGTLGVCVYAPQGVLLPPPEVVPPAM